MDKFLIMQLRPKSFKFWPANIVLVMQDILTRIIYLFPTKVFDIILTSKN